MTDGWALDTLDEEVLAEVLEICRIPSPTFAEEARARYIRDRLRQFDVQDVETDGLWNVSGLVPGAGGGPTVMVVAHIDTVFPAGTDVEPRSDGRYWRAPGIRDNSASAAITLMLPEILRRNGLHLRGDLILAFSVGEEGLGDLCGVKALVDRFGPRIDCVLAADGNLGIISHQGVGARRLKVVATAQGGHSWADAGKPSAVHHLARIAADISRIPLSAKPKTSLNIGVLEGGTSINAIAQQARMLIDMRSTDQEALAHLESQVRAVLATEADGVDVASELVGDRPGGSIPADDPLVQAILESYRQVGVEARLQASSTDANIPLSRGIPAASIGVSAGGGIHTLDEYLDPRSLPLGVRSLVMSLLALQRRSS